jgi:hypothetical protein
MLRRGDLSTLPANQVQVRSVFINGIHRLSLPEVGASNQAFLHQQIQRPVYGRPVDGPGSGLDPVVNLIRGQMSGVMNNFVNDNFSLWGDAVPSRPECFHVGMAVGHFILVLMQLFADAFIINYGHFVSITQNDPFAYKNSQFY